MVSTSAWHAVVRGAITGPGMLYLIFRCKNLALNITVCVSLVGCASSVAGAPLCNLGKLIYHTLPVSLGWETIFSCSSLLSSAYARGSIKSHTGGKRCNLSWTPHSSLEKVNSLNNSCVSPRMGHLEYITTVVSRTKQEEELFEGSYLKERGRYDLP